MAENVSSDITIGRLREALALLESARTLLGVSGLEGARADVEKVVKAVTREVERAEHRQKPVRIGEMVLCVSSYAPTGEKGELLGVGRDYARVRHRGRDCSFSLENGVKRGSANVSLHPDDLFRIRRDLQRKGGST